MRLESLDIDHPAEARAELDVLAEQLQSGGWNVEVAGPGEPTLSRFRESAEGAFVDVLNLVLDEAERHAMDIVLAAIFAWAADRMHFRGREGARPVVVIYVGDEDVREEPLPEPRKPVSTETEDETPSPTAYVMTRRSSSANADKAMAPDQPNGLPHGQSETAMLAAYQVLASRYASTTAFQWQVPAFGIAGQAAILVAITTAHTLGIALALGGTSLFVALAVTGVTRRAELTALWDRHMLDQYEQMLLVDSLRMYHTLRVHGRLERQPFEFREGPFSPELELAAVRFAPPSFLLCLTMVVLAVVSIVVAAV